MINFVKGNIEEQDTDVIVNSANASLAWEETTMNGDVHNAAGPEFTKACQRYVEENGKLEVGDLAVIDGFDLKCKKVYNVFSPTAYEENVRKKYFRMMLYFFRKFRMSEYNSISIPAVGTGVFEIPVDYVRLTLISHAARCDMSGEQEFRFVLFDDEMYNKFTEFYDRHYGQSKNK